jgi:Zn2+/Cd2+-exporting ATPase
MEFIKEHTEGAIAFTCGLLVLLGYLALQSQSIYVALFILACAYIIGGYQSAIEGLMTLWQEREFDVDLLMIIAALGAAGLGIWQQEYGLIIDGAVLILIFAISGALEGYAMGRTERSISSLMSLSADVARLLEDGKERLVKIENLSIGDKIAVKPGELIPTDGVVFSGISTNDRSAITGESLPVDLHPGDRVFGGTLNGNGAMVIEIDRSPESSLIKRIIHLVRQAQTEVPASQQSIEKFERGYAKVIIIVGLLLGTLPPFISHADWETTIYRALIFLVVASPCALMAAIMPTLLSGIANGARQGILFKGGSTLEAIGKVKAIAYDKTGTLTEGKLQIVEIIPTTDLNPDRILQLAAAIESNSEHAIGAAICQSARERDLDIPSATDIVTVPGMGISGSVNNSRIWLGTARSMPPEIAIEIDKLSPQIAGLETAGKTIVWVVYNDRVCGAIALADTIRSAAKLLVTDLKQMGIIQIMLTGDNRGSAEKIASELGIDRVYAELLPTDKVELIRQLQTEYQQVAMVGDGINDAPALAVADVGIAMGKTGTDVAIETADIILMTDDLNKIDRAIKLGRRTQSIVIQNIIFALSLIAILLLGNFLGKIDLPLGVLGHEGSTVLVTLSGLRLLTGDRD